MKQQRRTRYAEIADSLRQAIASGEHPPGTLLPSETAMVQTYGVSHSTIRRAIADLQAEGLVRPEHGRGTVVCHAPVAPIVTRRTINDPTAGLDPIGEPLHLMQQACPDAAELLQINRNHPLYVLVQTLRTPDDQRVTLRRLLPMAAIANTVLEDDPFPPRDRLITFLAGQHGPITATERIRYRDPQNPDEAATLGIAPTGTIAETTRLTLAGGRPVLAEVQHINAKAIEYEYRLS